MTKRANDYDFYTNGKELKIALYLADENGQILEEYEDIAFNRQAAEQLFQSGLLFVRTKMPKTTEAGNPKPLKPEGPEPKIEE